MSKLWGGRFNKKTDPLVENFTKSIQFDYKLAQADIIGSIAHVEILRKAGYLTVSQAAKFQNGLKKNPKKFKNKKKKKKILKLTATAKIFIQTSKMP